MKDKIYFVDIVDNCQVLEQAVRESQAKKNSEPSPASDDDEENENESSKPSRGTFS